MIYLSLAFKYVHYRAVQCDVSESNWNSCVYLIFYRVAMHVEGDPPSSLASVVLEHVSQKNKTRQMNYKTWSCLVSLDNSIFDQKS